MGFSGSGFSRVQGSGFQVLRAILGFRVESVDILEF